VTTLNTLVNTAAIAGNRVLKGRVKLQKYRSGEGKCAAILKARTMFGA
jgi:hypothetical protein